MKIILNLLILLSLVSGFSACGGNSEGSSLSETSSMSFTTAAETGSASLTESETESLLKSLDEIAELERAGSWLQGMALTESSIREQLGDFPGAVVSAYKELSLAYGRGLLQKHDVEQGLKNLLELNGDISVAETANAVLAFLNGQWKEAEAKLSFIFTNEAEPDSFVNWMHLVCTLERNRFSDSDENKRASSVYRSIRARYAQFPEYWYRGAKAFNGTIAAEYAENCINLSIQGPFAEECRQILADFIGLKKEDALSIKTKREIDAFISQSITTGDPQMLEPLLPLIGLPDNPYTVYAVGLLKNLSSSIKFREYFSAKASASNGRLMERLIYLSRS